MLPIVDRKPRNIYDQKAKIGQGPALTEDMRILWMSQSAIVIRHSPFAMAVVMPMKRAKGRCFWETDHGEATFESEQRQANELLGRLARPDSKWLSSSMLSVIAYVALDLGTFNAPCPK